MRPKRGKSCVHHKPCGLDTKTQERITHIRTFLIHYTDAEREQPGKRGNWSRASELAARGTGRGVKSYSEKLRLWARELISDSRELPRVNHGGGIRSVIDDDDIAQDIKIHLQGIGKYIKAQDIVNFCATPEMLVRLG